MIDKKSPWLVSEIIESSKIRSALPVMVHQMSNSWHGVSAALRIVERRSDMEPETRELLEKIRAEIAKASSFSKEMMTQLELFLDFGNSVRMPQLVENVSEFIETRPGNGARIATCIESDACVPGSESLLFQMLIHVIDNAVESQSDSQEPISVRLYDCNNHPNFPDEQVVCVQVKDSGCGMDADLLAKCNAPLVTTKPNHQGLGLTAASKIIERHCGKLKFESAVGSGTTVTCIIPYDSV